jgi:hypothetical protein
MSPLEARATTFAPPLCAIHRALDAVHILLALALRLLYF